MIRTALGCQNSGADGGPWVRDLSGLGRRHRMSPFRIITSGDTRAHVPATEDHGGAHVDLGHLRHVAEHVGHGVLGAGGPTVISNPSASSSENRRPNRVIQKSSYTMVIMISPNTELYLVFKMIHQQFKGTLISKKYSNYRWWIIGIFFVKALPTDALDTLRSPMILSSERSLAIQINTLSRNKPALSAWCLALNSVCKKTYIVYFVGEKKWYVISMYSWRKHKR